jgi:FkbM family methyltransferase
VKLKDIRKSYHTNAISKPEYIEKMHEVHAILFEYAGYIQNTDIAKIEISDGIVLMTSRTLGVKIACDKDDRRIAPIEILNFGEYEKYDSAMIFRLIKANNTVMDIGANIGWYSISIAKRIPDAQVYSFEPIPKTFELLTRNVALNQSPAIKLNNFGFSNVEEDITFYYYPEGSGNASSTNLTDRDTVEKISCRVTTLDVFCAQEKIAVDFIKCDVEGAELFVFQGGIKTINKDKPIIFAEILRKWAAKFNYHPNDIIKLFASMGYRCFVAKAHTLVEFTSVDEHTTETNFFFLHNTKHANEIRSLL